MVRNLVVAAVMLATPMGAMAQTASATGGRQATGQQQSQPSATQNQSQMQTDNSQQPPEAHVLPPSASAQSQPNPMPQLAK